MSLNPGDLNTEGTLQKPRGRQADGGGGYTTTGWMPVDEEAVQDLHVEPLLGSERLRAMQTQANATHRVTIRYRDEVRASYRWLLEDGRVLHIVSPPMDPDNKHELLQMLCREET